MALLSDSGLQLRTLAPTDSGFISLCSFLALSRAFWNDLKVGLSLGMFTFPFLPFTLNNFNITEWLLAFQGFSVIVLRVLISRLLMYVRCRICQKQDFRKLEVVKKILTTVCFDAVHYNAEEENYSFYRHWSEKASECRLPHRVLYGKCPWV